MNIQYNYNYSPKPEGNLTQKRYTGTDGKTSTTVYTYNYQGQLERVVKDGKTLGNYQYNHKRLRVYSNTNSSALWGGEKYYYWDGFEHIIGEGSVEHGDHIVRYIYSGNEKIAMVRPKDLKDRSKGEAIYWFVNNAQGTPTKIVNESGTVVQYNNVDEWGNPTIPSAGNHAEINFTGKKYDPITGLYYFNQRYYSPALGMFLSEDPAGQGLNPYAYCGNNPMGYVDPDGEFFFLAPLVGAMVQGAVYGAATNAIISGAVAAATGGNVLGAMWSGAVNGAISGALSGGVGFGVGAIGSNIAGAVGLGNQWNAALTGLNTAMTAVQSYNIGQGLYNGLSSGNWGQLAGAAAQGAGPFWNESNC